MVIVSRSQYLFWSVERMGIVSGSEYRTFECGENGLI